MHHFKALNLFYRSTDDNLLERSVSWVCSQDVFMHVGPNIRGGGTWCTDTGCGAVDQDRDASPVRVFAITPPHGKFVENETPVSASLTYTKVEKLYSGTVMEIILRVKYFKYFTKSGCKYYLNSILKYFNVPLLFKIRFKIGQWRILPGTGAVMPSPRWRPGNFFRQYINIIGKPTAYDGRREY